MIKLIKYFFYKIYSFSLSNDENDPSWALAIVTLFLISNVYFLLDLIMIFTNSKIPQINGFVILVLCCLILYLNFIFLVKNGKTIEIVKEFKENKQKKTILNIFLSLYIIFSIIMCIYTGNIVRSMNK